VRRTGTQREPTVGTELGQHRRSRPRGRFEPQLRVRPYAPYGTMGIVICSEIAYDSTRQELLGVLGGGGAGEPCSDAPERDGRHPRRLPSEPRNHGCRRDRRGHGRSLLFNIFRPTDFVPPTDHQAAVPPNTTQSDRGKLAQACDLHAVTWVPKFSRAQAELWERESADIPDWRRKRRKL